MVPPSMLFNSKHRSAFFVCLFVYIRLKAELSDTFLSSFAKQKIPPNIIRIGVPSICILYPLYINFYLCVPLHSQQKSQEQEQLQQFICRLGNVMVEHSL